MAEASDCGLERAAPPTSTPAPAGQVYPIEFTGTAGEYFRIWIVNLTLTIVTLGIYSAWAKVRKRRYFYSHTRIDGEGFEYRARPAAILKGRVIAVLLLAALLVITGSLPDDRSGARASKLLFLSVALFVGPWLMNCSLKFNAANTVYRNVPFRFLGTYLRWFDVFLRCWWVIFTIPYPYFRQRVAKYAAQNHAYGTTRFEVLDFESDFIAAYLPAYLVGVVAVVVLVTISDNSSPESWAPLFSAIPVCLLLLLLYAYVRAKTANAVWNKVRIGPVRFESNLRGREYVWIYFSNTLAILFTLGLATPWAVIRTLRYRARHVTLIAAGPLDAFLPAEPERVSATGEEVADLLDFDIGL